MHSAEEYGAARTQFQAFNTMMQIIIIGLTIIIVMLIYLSFRLEEILAMGIHETRAWEISGDDVKKIVELVVEELEKRK